MAEPAWAGTRLDAWLAAGLVVLSLSWLLAMPAGAPYRPVDGRPSPLAVLGPAALMWRQTAPLVALSVAGGVVVVNAAVGGADRLPGLAGLDRAVHLLRRRRAAGPPAAGR